MNRRVLQEITCFYSCCIFYVFLLMYSCIFDRRRFVDCIAGSCAGSSLSRRGSRPTVSLQVHHHHHQEAKLYSTQKPNDHAKGTAIFGTVPERKDWYPYWEAYWPELLNLSPGTEPRSLGTVSTALATRVSLSGWLQQPGTLLLGSLMATHHRQVKNQKYFSTRIRIQRWSAGARCILGQAP